MGRRFLWVSLSAVIILLAAAACAMAVEASLAGVKLDQPVIDLLKNPMIGQPQYIGPAGVISAVGTSPGPAPALAPVAVPAMPFGSAGAYFGAGAAAPTPVAPIAAAAAPVRPELAGSTLYWLYTRGGESMVVGVRPDGSVSSVQVTGIFGRTRTARGVTLATPYQRVLALYGFPDETTNIANLLMMRYYDDGLTLTLTNLAVNSILLEATPSALAAPSAPAFGPFAPAAPAPAIGGGWIREPKGRE
jgi:hypothetical protein